MLFVCREAAGSEPAAGVTDIELLFRVGCAVLSRAIIYVFMFELAERGVVYVSGALPKMASSDF